MIDLFGIDIRLRMKYFLFFAHDCLLQKLDSALDYVLETVRGQLLSENVTHALPFPVYLL